MLILEKKLWQTTVESLSAEAKGSKEANFTVWVANSSTLYRFKKVSELQLNLGKKNLVLYIFKKASHLGADLQLFSVKVSLALFRNNISRALLEIYDLPLKKFHKWTLKTPVLSWRNWIK